MKKEIGDFRALEIVTDRGFRVLDQAKFSDIDFSLENALDNILDSNAQKLDITYTKRGVISRYILERRK